MMGWLARLFSKPRRLEDDPDFGPMEWHAGAWSTLPENGRFDHAIHIFAPESGPTDEQRRFLREFRNNRAAWESLAKAFIASRDPDVNLAQLRLYALEIGPDEELGTGSFTLEFTDDDEIEIRRIDFANQIPWEYGVDD